ncbi:MAG: efflux RND transporter periplasmic adaptor subunit [Gammaproteobacteria bacterium]|nr:efflux RND transporter periplasmic adaptor subunit [Gammaproteobacteria bacterium]
MEPPRPSTRAVFFCYGRRLYPVYFTTPDKEIVVPAASRARLSRRAAPLLALLLSLAAAGHAIAATQVIVAPARVERLDDRIEALGTLRSSESVQISSSITETVSAVYFDDGDRVPAGKPLVEMTSDEEHAQLEEARATVDEARRQYERVQSLQEQGTAAASLLDERQRDLETARARLGAIESRLKDRIIKAPFAGVIGLRNVSVGALVEPGDLIATLDDDNRMKLEFSVPSLYLGSLATGLPVVAVTAAFGAREFHGAVTAVDSRVDPVTRSVLVRAILPNPDRSLRPGLLMQVHLLRNVRDGIVIPEEALMPLGDRQFVLVVNEADNNTVERREVRLGARRPGQAEILEGLRAGEKVITHGTTRVKPGDQVAVAAVDDGTVPLRELLEKMP